MTGTASKRRWREAHPERERALSQRNRAEWYARGGWATDEKRKRLVYQAERIQRLKELYGKEE